MKNLKLLTLLLSISLSLISCSDADDSEKSSSKAETKSDHVWKTQTDALQSAKDMAEKMNESLKQQQEKMDENN